MIVRALSLCGVHGRWVLPVGLLAGLFMPWAAQPMKSLIPVCIALLLFLAVLRLFPDTIAVTKEVSAPDWIGSAKLVFVYQLAFPLLVFAVTSWADLPALWILAMTLVAAAPPISGSPNLVMLLSGNGSAAMRWLMLGTAFLPLTCLPVLYLLYPEQSASIMIRPSLVLLVLIIGSVACAMLFLKANRSFGIALKAEVLDGASAIVLAVMVIGLMSAVHEPDVNLVSVLKMLAFAIAVNAGYQLLGVALAKLRALNVASTITQGVVLGNRNIALYLTALPAAQIEPLLLFIACYQVPMYLTPLIGDVFYRRLE